MEAMSTPQSTQIRMFFEVLMFNDPVALYIDPVVNISIPGGLLDYINRNASFRDVAL